MQQQNRVRAGLAQVAGPFGMMKHVIKRERSTPAGCKEDMIHREDMLELTRRFTLSRSSLDRIAGAYFDEEGYVEGTFNKNILHLSQADSSKNLKLAKEILFSRTNEQLKEYRIEASARRAGGIWQLLDGIKESSMKNDALLDIFYELLGEQYRYGKPFFCFFFHGTYDVPQKGTDGEWLEGSEEVYEYLICAVGPYTGEYEPGEPEFGFLYPAFRERSTGWDYVNIYSRNAGALERGITEWLLRG